MLSPILSRLPFLETIVRRLNQYQAKLADGPAGRALKPIVAKLRQLGLISSPMRFVLTIGDEGATLVKFHGQQVVDAIFIGPESEDGLGTLTSYLSEDPQAELVVAADVLEQMYREEALPSVSRWDRITIVKRRLEVAFPHDRLRAAVQISRGKATASTVLFTALPVTSQLEQWIAFLEGLSNPIIGFCLLPLESEMLGARLVPPAADDGRRVWHALVSQQATSGFRQIFESQGNLVVTRLTQRPPGELTADGVAQLIERELRSSINYVKRLGYTEGDRLDLIVLASPDVCAAVEQRDLPVASLTTMSPRRAAEVLGLGEVGPPESPYADVLHAANLAFKRRLRASLPTEKMAERLINALMFRVSFVAASAIVLFSVLYVGSIIVGVYDTLTTAQTLRSTVASEQRALDALRQRSKGYEIPLDDLEAVGQTDDALRKTQIDPATVIWRVAGALDQTVRVRKIAYTAPPMAMFAPPTPPPTRGGRTAVPLSAAYELVLSVEFLAASGAADDLLARTREFKNRLTQAFPAHDVTVTRTPGRMGSQVLQGTGAIKTQAETPEMSQAEYTIRKRL